MRRKFKMYKNELSSLLLPPKKLFGLVRFPSTPPLPRTKVLFEWSYGMLLVKKLFRPKQNVMWFSPALNTLNLTQKDFVSPHIPPYRHFEE